jgi:hypothetical protein
VRWGSRGWVKKRNSLRGIMPAGIEPGTPNGGGGMPPIKGLVSIGI